MDNFNLGHMIAKFTSYQIKGSSVSGAKPQTSGAQNFNPAPSASSSAPASQAAGGNNVQMGSLGGSDTSVYIKDLMKFPRNLNEFIYMLQKNMNQMQFNRMYEMANRRAMSQQQAQILAQLQGLSTQDLQNALKTQLNTQLASTLKNLQISPGAMINLSEIATLIQTNGKDAITKLILTMAAASKQGVSDMSQLKETAKLINASIALASQENPTQTLKTLMLLYLPWLPLADGSGFDLEIEAGSSGEEKDSVLVVTITTINFGNVTATLILETSNSVHVNIACSEEFPKDELLNRIQGEEKHYSMQSVISFETVASKPVDIEQTKAKINMSSTNEINPYLLLMAHAIIRNTIIIDNNASQGVVSHKD